MSRVLAVTQLSKTYGDIVAVDRISFDVGPNEIVGLLGQNGAGKTTTINMILGVLTPDSGSISVEGIEIRTHRPQALQRTNFAAVYAPLPGNLTVRRRAIELEPNDAYAHLFHSAATFRHSAITKRPLQR